MSKRSKAIIVFTVSFIIAYFLVSYIRDSLFISIKWAEDATLWDKFRELYIRSFGYSFIPALIIAALSTTIISLKNR